MDGSFSKYRDFGLSYLRGGKYSRVIGRDGDQGIIDAQLMENPVDQLHRYVRILLGGRIEEPFRILGCGGGLFMSFTASRSSCAKITK